MIGRVLGLGVLGGGLWWWVRRCTCERIEIRVPATAGTVSSPVTVSGFGQAMQHNQLALRVRDQAGAEIGTGSAAVSGALGARGPFNGAVAYTLGGGTQPGRIEVYDTSPRDGNLIHLASVEVALA